MATKEYISILYEEADAIRALVTTDADGKKNYDRAGRILVGLLNLFGTGMCGVEMDNDTSDVLGGISSRLVREEIQQIAKVKERRKGRG